MASYDFDFVLSAQTITFATCYWLIRQSEGLPWIEQVVLVSHDAHKVRSQLLYQQKGRSQKASDAIRPTKG